MARKISKNQSKTKAKTSNNKNKNQLPEMEKQNENLTMDSRIVEEAVQSPVAKPSKKSAKKAAIADNSETKEQLMKRVNHELIKTVLTAAVSMAAGIMLAEFVTLH